MTILGKIKYEIINFLTKITNKLFTNRIIYEINELKKLNNEVLFGQVFNNLINNSDWVNDKNFIPRKNAANNSFLYILFIILEKATPKHILEFGMGQSTKLTTQYVLNKNKEALLTAVDHDKNWLNCFLENDSLSNERIRFVHKNLEKFYFKGTESDKYESLEDICNNQKFDLVVVDEPFGFDRKYPRTNILDLIPNYLNEDFIILFDDVERKGEQNTLELLFDKLRNNKIEFVTSYTEGTKKQCIITTKKYKNISFY